MATTGGSSRKPSAVALLEVSCVDDLLKSKPDQWQMIRLSTKSQVSLMTVTGAVQSVMYLGGESSGSITVIQRLTFSCRPQYYFMGDAVQALHDDACDLQTDIYMSFFPDMPTHNRIRTNQGQGSNQKSAFSQFRITVTTSQTITRVVNFTGQRKLSVRANDDRVSHRQRTDSIHELLCTQESGLPATPWADPTPAGQDPWGPHQPSLHSLQPRLPVLD